MSQSIEPMPRFKFQWSNIPAALLRDLAVGLGVSGEPAEALKQRFGPKPQAEFIKDAWPILLQKWLPTDTAARHELCHALRSRGLGKGEIRDNMSYLQSCNNSASLRNEALRLFMELGERSGAGAPSTITTNETEHAKRVEDDPVNVSLPPTCTREEMLAFAKKVVASMYEVGEDDLLVDSDGDLFIPAGSAGVFLRAREEPDEFRIFAPLLSDVTETPLMHTLLNKINCDLRYGCMFFTNGTIILDHGLIGRTIHPMQLRIIIDIITNAADFYDDKLQEKLGGKLFFNQRAEDEIEV